MGKYMAFIMADGNSFGQMLESINDPEIYKGFSWELYDLTLNAVVSAIFKSKIHKKDFDKQLEDKRHRLLPFIPVILAGDDLSFLTRAEDAADFTYQLCNEIAELSQREDLYPNIRKVISDFRGEERSAWPLSFSAGFGITKKTFPIPALQQQKERITNLSCYFNLDIVEYAGKNKL